MFLRKLTLLKDIISSDEEYPFSTPSIGSIDSLTFRSNVTFFVGENGSGKSTLLEAIAYCCGFNTAGGGRNNTYNVPSSEAVLGEYVRLSWSPKVTNGFFLRSESFFEFASHIDSLGVYEPYGGKSLHHQSHGESFFSLFLNRFGTRGIYLLDEPEAALSPARQLAFLQILKELGSHSQFIIATHSPIIMAFPGAQILNFDSCPIEEVEYESTDHYLITKGFFDNKELYLRKLFE